RGLQPRLSLGQTGLRLRNVDASPFTHLQPILRRLQLGLEEVEVLLAEREQFATTEYGHIGLYDRQQHILLGITELVLASLRPGASGLVLRCGTIVVVYGLPVGQASA